MENTLLEWKFDFNSMTGGCHVEIKMCFNFSAAGF